MIGPEDVPRITEITLPEPREAWVTKDRGKGADPRVVIHHVELLACRTYEPGKGQEVSRSWWLGVHHPDNPNADFAYLHWWEERNVHLTEEEAELRAGRFDDS